MPKDFLFLSVLLLQLVDYTVQATLFKIKNQLPDDKRTRTLLYILIKIFIRKIVYKILFNNKSSVRTKNPRQFFKILTNSNHHFFCQKTGIAQE